jgi:hypothetical protein
MKKILTLIVASMLALSSQSFAKDFGDYFVDFELRGTQDSWSAAGTNENGTRFMGSAELNFGYKINDSFSIELENTVNEWQDNNATLFYSHTISLKYETSGFDFSVGGSVEDTDKDAPSDGNQQSSYANYEIGYTIPQGYRFSYEFMDELSDGSINSSRTDRYVDEIHVFEIEKTFDDPTGFGKDFEVTAFYMDAEGLRETYSIDVDYNLTDNYGVGFRAGENDGKGIFANNAGQNRDFAAVSVFFKY